jgi:hypothetical protein
MLSGGVDLLDELLVFFPAGDFVNNLLGGSFSQLPGGSAVHTGIYPEVTNHFSTPTVIVNTQLEKAGMYRVYREGKLISESRPV